MRFIHTSDWHLGQTLHGYDRLPEQRLFLEWLRAQLKTYACDALLVAGDIFDTISPSAAAQRLLYEFLANVNRDLPDLQVVLTAGNHDSGVRLEAPIAILEALNVHVFGVLPRQDDRLIDYSALSLQLRGADGSRVTCLPIPFLRAADCPTPQEGEAPETAFFQQLATIYTPDRQPIVCMGHLYAHGAQVSRSDASERVVGGLEGVADMAFPPHYCYVALGHIHRRQKVYGRDTIRYSGAPLPMSFAEKGYQHGVQLVTITDGQANVESLDYHSPVQLLQLEGTAEAVRSQIEALPRCEPDDQAPIVALRLELQAPMPTLKADITQWAEGRYLRLGPMEVIYRGAQNETLRVETAHPRAIEPIDIAQQEWQRRYGAPMPSDLQALFYDAIREAAL